MFLAELAAQLRILPGRHLVMLHSRASAGRLAGMVPGSLLLSSSLCRAHLAQRMTEIAAHPAQDLTVIATTLPATPMGLFDRVYHLLAPLPHLAEAAALSRSPLQLIQLHDVAVPPAWAQAMQLTMDLLSQGQSPSDPQVQRHYAEQLQAAIPQRNRSLPWQQLRSQQQYASLASELAAQRGSAVPALIAFDAEGQQVIETYRERSWLSSRDLRYAAWITSTEAQQALRSGEAKQTGSGWALVWQGRYDPNYGLAWPYVEQALAANDEHE